MATATSFKRWINVPDQATLTVTTGAQPPNVRIDIHFTLDDGTTISWTTNEVLNTSKKLTLRSPRRYDITVDMIFAGAKTTLSFDARITKPDGTPHGKPFTFDATPQTQPQHADISIITKD